MNFKYLKLNINSQGIAKLLFSNTKSKNAFNPIMLLEIKKALKFLEKSRKCRILIFSGEGDSFSSGADLSWMKKSKNLNYRQNKKESIGFTQMLKAIDCFTKPTISLVNGHAFGGALGVIAVSDYSLSFKKSKFCFSEVKLGLIPAMIAPYIVRSIGLRETKKLFLTGEVFDTKKALKVGLIDEIIDENDIQINSLELIKNLIQAAPVAQYKIKSFLKEIYLKKINDSLIDQTAETISRIRITKEAQEGLGAFLEKRKPNWSKIDS